MTAYMIVKNDEKTKKKSCLAYSPEVKYALDIPDAGGLQ